MTPRLKINASLDAAELVADVVMELTNPRRPLLGELPGSIHHENLGGRHFVAHRLRCGGIEIKEAR